MDTLLYSMTIRTGNKWIVNPRYQGIIGVLRGIFKREKDYANHIYIEQNEAVIYKVPIILGEENEINFDEPILLKESDLLKLSVSLKKYYIPNDVEMTSQDYVLV